MPTQVLWIKVKQAHLSRVARCWTIMSIVVQILGLVSIIMSFCLLDMIVFDDQGGKLTPIFYIHEHRFTFFFSTLTWNQSECNEKMEMELDNRA